MAAEVNEAVKLVSDTDCERRHARNRCRGRIVNGRIELLIEIMESIPDVREVNNVETVVASRPHFNPGEFLGRVRIQVEIDTLNTVVGIDSVGGRKHRLSARKHARVIVKVESEQFRRTQDIFHDACYTVNRVDIGQTRLEKKGEGRRCGPRNRQAFRRGAIGDCIPGCSPWNCVELCLKFGRNFRGRVLARCKSHFDFGTSPFCKHEIIPGGSYIIEVGGNGPRDELNRHDVFERAAKFPAEIVAVIRLCAAAVLAVYFHRYLALFPALTTGFG